MLEFSQFDQNESNENWERQEKGGFKADMLQKYSHSNTDKQILESCFKHCCFQGSHILGCHS